MDHFIKIKSCYYFEIVFSDSFERNITKNTLTLTPTTWQLTMTVFLELLDAHPIVAVFGVSLPNIFWLVTS